MDLEPVASASSSPQAAVEGGQQPAIDVSPEEAGIRFEVRGCLDEATAGLLAALLESADQVDVEVVAVDVQHVTDFTEQGLSALRRTLASAPGRRPKVRYRAGPRSANALLLAATSATWGGAGTT